MVTEHTSSFTKAQTKAWSVYVLSLLVEHQRQLEAPHISDYASAEGLETTNAVHGAASLSGSQASGNNDGSGEGSTSDSTNNDSSRLRRSIEELVFEESDSRTRFFNAPSKLGPTGPTLTTPQPPEPAAGRAASPTSEIVNLYGDEIIVDGKEWDSRPIIVKKGEGVYVRVPAPGYFPLARLGMPCIALKDPQDGSYRVYSTATGHVLPEKEAITWLSKAHKDMQHAQQRFADAEARTASNDAKDVSSKSSYQATGFEAPHRYAISQGIIPASIATSSK
jgi:hypothetical protein